tara:strand:- start:312 stop:920 length:609 start_codon:yes stop_codon:yes gene_type:complete
MSANLTPKSLLKKVKEIANGYGEEPPEKITNYYKRLIVIENLLKITYTNIKFGFDYDWEWEFFSINLIDPQRACYTEKIDADWKYIKKTLDNLISNSNERERDCPICFESIGCGFGCEVCTEVLCFKCKYTIKLRNKGLFKCPFCREESGEEQSRKEIMEDAQFNLDEFCNKSGHPRIKLNNNQENEFRNGDKLIRLLNLTE